MKSTIRLARVAGLALTFACAPLYAAGTTVFIDEFDDGNPKSVDAQTPNYWKAHLAGWLNKWVKTEEVNGEITMRTNDEWFGGYFSPLESQFSFFDMPQGQRMKIIIRGLKISLAEESVDPFTFVVASAQDEPFNYTHIKMQMRADRRFHMFAEEINTDPQFNAPRKRVIGLVDARYRLQEVPDVIELSLDATRYEVLMRFSGDPEIPAMDCSGFFYAGNHNLTKAIWDQAAPGTASIGFGTLNTTTDSQITLDAIEVVHEPSGSTVLCPNAP